MRFPFFPVIVLGLLVAAGAQASLEDVSYPIAELGNCDSQESCFEYCGDSANYDACMAYAQENGLLEEEEIEQYEQVQASLEEGGGPGGCTSQEECEAYCSDLSNIDECLAFAEEQGLMSEEELEEAQQIQAALDAGYSLPGGCSSEEECEAYCSELENMEECLAFAEASGIMSEEEIAEAETFMSIMESGETPGGCESQTECEEYCADEANLEECLAFAVEAGFMTQEEADSALEMGGDEEDFEGPGGCTDEESCSAYCEQEENQEECQEFFGEEVGGDYEGSEDFVGPGGCTSEEECQAYCSDEANQETCAAFFGTLEEDEHSDDVNEYSEGDEGESAYDESSQDQEEHEGEDYEGDGYESYEEDGQDGPYSKGEEYQYEGSETYNIYDHGEEDSYEYDNDEFESFDPGETELDFEQEGDGSSYEEIYVEPPSDSSGESSSPETGGEPHSSADARFVDSANRLLEKILEFLSI